MNKSIILDEIKRYIEEGEMSFLIGAGFSRNVSKQAYLLWDGMLKDAILEAFGNGTKTKQKDKVVAEAIKNYGYLGIASKIVKKAGYHETIDTYIEGKIPYLKTIDDKPVLLLGGNPMPNSVNSECHLLLKNLDVQNIYTFNYDNALEFFMGEEAKRALEEKIKASELKIGELQSSIKELEQQESALIGKLESLLKPENSLNAEGTVENDDEEIPDIKKLKQDINDIKRNRIERKTELSELIANVAKDKESLKTYYNVVKDSYEISLSAKQKSIYKIHGSLRESNKADYGFDGDLHAQYIITQEDYDTYNEKHGAFVSMMRIDLLRNKFCIMGVSGGDANFLAWINWVKDVLDKTKARSKDNKDHNSFFIYSGTADMPADFALMLRNHFIEPVILKDIFPPAKNDEQRIKLFLEYLQPLSNKDTSALSKLWKGVEIPSFNSHSAKVLPDKDADELFRLSNFNKFNSPHSAAHYKAADVQFLARYYFRDGAPKSDKMVFAAAIQTSLMPIDVTCSKDDFVLMDKETDKSIVKVFNDAARRAILLQQVSGKDNVKLIKEDSYTRILYNLYNYQFPTHKEVEVLNKRVGIDFVRQCSLLKLLGADFPTDGKCEATDFNSPQELVLAADWLRYIGYKNPTLYQKADDYKKRWNLLSFYDYYQAYLSAMRRKEEINTYGNVNETYYLDKYTSDVINGAVLINSFVELGVCFAGQSIMEDGEWLEIVRALKQRYPKPMAFYTIVRHSKVKILKLVAQELMYDEDSRKVLPDILRSIMLSLLTETTPLYTKIKMAQFASEILPTVSSKHWLRQFVANAEKILDIADTHRGYFDLEKAMYGFVAKALEYVSAKELRLCLLKRIFEKMKWDDEYGMHFNTLAISAREHLKPADFAPLYNNFVAFAEKIKQHKNQQASFVVMNLLILLDKKQKPKILELIEYRAVRDSYLIGGYVSHIKDYPKLVSSFLDYFFKGEDLWNTGITKTGIHMGTVDVNVSRFDKLLHFNDEQVAYAYNDMKITLEKINSSIIRRKQTKQEKDWMSLENNFQEHVADMLLFVHQRQKQLEKCNDFKETYYLLYSTYERCFYGRNILQLIADDEIYMAIRRIMTEVEWRDIDDFKLEYEQMMGRLITKDTKELKILFMHISWAIKHYKTFFNTSNFMILLETVLKVYQPYFDTDYELEQWNLLGCQKEVAEKALVSIAQTLEGWDSKDEFWNKYHRVFYLR